MAINSRAKGARAERDVAGLLSSWTGKKFAKTPGSGGLNWQSAMAKGDVVCTTEGHYFPFCIEVKCYKDIRFEHALLDMTGKKTNQIFTWWEQASRDAKLAKKIPMLMMRYNGMPSSLYFLAFPTEWFSKACPAYIFARSMKINDIKNKVHLTIVRSDEFFQSRAYKELKTFTKTYLKSLYK